MPPHLRLTLVTLGDPHRLSGGYLYHLRLAELAPGNDAEVHFASIPDRRVPFQLLANRQLVREVSVQQPDAVIVDSIAAALLFPVRSWAERAPLIASTHQPPGGFDGGLEQRFRRHRDLAVYHRCRLLVAASPLLAEELESSGLERDRILVVPPGRNPSDEPVEPVKDMRHGRRVAALCVANWIPLKGIDCLLEAVATLPEHAVTLHLVGRTDVDAAHAATIRRLLDRPDLRDRCIVHGPVTRTEVAAFYAGADVFVLPSFSDQYGTVYGEAMAAGLPVVGWRAGNLPNLAEHGKQGLVLEPGDVAGLADALRPLADDQDFRGRLASAAAHRAAKLPTWRESAARFFDAVRQAIAS